MSNRVENRIAWIDTETLGSDRPTTPVIEIAIAITDNALKVLQQKSWLLPRNFLHARIDKIDPNVIEMHARNGLWRDLHAAATRDTLPLNGDITQSIVTWLRHVTQPKPGERILVAGSGFDHFDRPILEYQMPELTRLLTYYSLDIGTAERILEIIGGIPKDTIDTDHRAMTCVLTQIERTRNMVGVIQRALGKPTEDNVLFIHGT